MTIRTKEKVTNKDGVEEEYTLIHRYGKIKVKNSTHAKIDDTDEDSDTISIPEGTEGYIVEFIDDDYIRVDLDIDLGNGIVYGLRNKLALKDEVELVESWGTENKPNGYYI